MIPTSDVFCTNFKNPGLPLKDHQLVKSNLLLFTCYTKEIVSIPLDAQSNQTQFPPNPSPPTQIFHQVRNLPSPTKNNCHPSPISFSCLQTSATALVCIFSTTLYHGQYQGKVQIRTFKSYFFVTKKTIKIRKTLHELFF